MDPQILNLVMLGGIAVVFYLFFIRPQAKKQKEQGQFMNAITKGDQVVTSAGIIGTVTKMDEKTITLRISDKAVMTILRSSVSKELSDQLKSDTTTN